MMPGSPSQRVRSWSQARARAFTLIEIMIVVGIIGVIGAAGIPAFVKLVSPEPLRKAVNDIVEGFSHARAQAIFRGVPMELVIRAADGTLSVQAAPPPAGSTNGSSGAVEIKFGSLPSAASVAAADSAHTFAAKLGDTIGIQLLYVNFVDQMQAEETHVRFYPNGTCDDFTMVLQGDGGVKKITLEVVTSLADIETLR